MLSCKIIELVLFICTCCFLGRPLLGFGASEAAAGIKLVFCRTPRPDFRFFAGEIFCSGFFAGGPSDGEKFDGGCFTGDFFAFLVAGVVGGGNSRAVSLNLGPGVTVISMTWTAACIWSPKL